tara:strand:+ start:1028 stop:1312 length:285 start_codon:yes stop_codon:yes gene_type:complete
MTKKSKTTTMEDTMKWKREAPGHYVLWGEYIVEEKEKMAEVKKTNNKWKYCLWTWGSQNPMPQEYCWQTYKTAKEVKNVVIDLVTNGEPKINKA